MYLRVDRRQALPLMRPRLWKGGCSTPICNTELRPLAQVALCLTQRGCKIDMCCRLSITVNSKAVHVAKPKKHSVALGR